MDQFHHVSTAFLELGKKSVFILAHLPKLNFNILYHIWSQVAVCFHPWSNQQQPFGFYYYCLLILGKRRGRGVYCLSLRHVTNIILWDSICYPFLSGILKFGYGIVVACCWCGGCQRHAPFNVIIYYVDNWLQIINNYGPLCLWWLCIL